MPYPGRRNKDAARVGHFCCAAFREMYSTIYWIVYSMRVLNGCCFSAAMRVAAFANYLCLFAESFAVGAAVFLFVGWNAATGGIGAGLGVAHGILLNAGMAYGEVRCEIERACVGIAFSSGHSAEPFTKVGRLCKRDSGSWRVSSSPALCGLPERPCCRVSQLL